jgi:Predicted transcriptional regulators
MSVFSDRLKELRLNTGKQQKDIAEYMGVLPRTIRFYESGEREPNIESINKLADFFGVSADYLLGRTNHWTDADGHITAKMPPDIFSDEDKKRIIKGLSKSDK